MEGKLARMHRLIRTADSRRMPAVDRAKLTALMAGDSKDKTLCLETIRNHIKLGRCRTQLDFFIELLQASLTGYNEWSVISDAALTLGVLLAQHRAESKFRIAIKVEIQRAIKWLQDDRSESPVYSALVILDALAKETPDEYYECILTAGVDFVDLMLPVLRHPKIMKREACASALRHSFDVILSREGQIRDRWYSEIFYFLEHPKKERVESVHGSLLVIPVLVAKDGLKHTNDLYEITRIVEKMLEAKSSVLVSTILESIPDIIAALKHGTQNNDQLGIFRASFVKKAIDFVRKMLRDSRTRYTAIVAYRRIMTIAKTSAVSNLEWFLLWVSQNMKKNLKPNEVDVVLECISEVTVTPTIESSFWSQSTTVKPLLDALLDTPLSSVMITTLQSLIIRVDAGHRSRIAIYVLSILKTMLLKYRDTQTPNALQQDNQFSEVLLALRTMATFEFGTGQYAPTHMGILNLILEVVLPYFQSSDTDIRHWVLLAAAKHLVPSVPLDSLKTDDSYSHQSMTEQNNGSVGVSRYTSDFTNQEQRPRNDSQAKNMDGLVMQILQTMLRVAVSDASYNIRLVALCSLDDPRLDRFLVRSVCWSLLFATLNDELIEVKLTGLKITGRLLTSEAPREFMPQLLSMFIKLVGTLHMRSKGEEADNLMVLAYYAHYAPTIVTAHIAPVIRIVKSHLESPTLDNALPLCMIVGQLAMIASDELRNELHTVVPALIKISKEFAVPELRRAAITAMGKVARGTSYVVNPYNDYPELFSILSTAWGSQTDLATRTEAVRVLGIICIPQTAHQIQIHQTKTHTNSIGNNDNGNPESSLLLDSLDIHTKKGSDAYFLSVVFNSLIRIACDPTLSMHHIAVSQAVMVIIELHHTEVKEHLDRCISAMVYMIRLAHESNLEETFSITTFHLVKVMLGTKDAIGNENGIKIINIVLDYWSPTATIIELVRAITMDLRAIVRPYLPTIFQNMRQAMVDDDTLDRSTTSRILSLIPEFGTLLDGWLDVFIPQIASTFDDITVPIGARDDAIQRVSQLADVVSIRDSAVILFHPLARAIESTPELITSGMDLLGKLMSQLGTDYDSFGFHTVMTDVIARNRVITDQYEATVIGGLRLNKLKDDEHDDDFESKSGSCAGAHPSLHVAQETLIEAWYISPDADEEDWAMWFKRVSYSMLKQSPYPALRACSHLAEYLPSLSAELFNAAFVSNWAELFPHNQEQIVTCLERALTNETLKNQDIKLIILNLAEFMQFMDKGRLPIEETRLGRAAYMAGAQAKALYYKERKFHLGSTPAHFQYLMANRWKALDRNADFGGYSNTSNTNTTTNNNTTTTTTTAASATANANSTFNPASSGGAIAFRFEGDPNALQTQHDKLAHDKLALLQEQQADGDAVLSNIMDAIDINNMLNLPESAVGSLIATQRSPILLRALEFYAHNPIATTSTTTSTTTAPMTPMTTPSTPTPSTPTPMTPTPRTPSLTPIPMASTITTILTPTPTPTPTTPTMTRLPSTPVPSLPTSSSISTSLSSSSISPSSTTWDHVLLRYRGTAWSPQISGENFLSYMLCMDKLCKWGQLKSTIDTVWKGLNEKNAQLVAPLACSTAVHTGSWGALKLYADRNSERDVMYMYLAVTAIHEQNYHGANKYIAASRRLLNPSSLASMHGSQNDRMINQMSHAHTLSELEEIIMYKLECNPQRRKLLLRTWKNRLYGCREDVGVWHTILKLRSLVLDPQDCIEEFLEFNEVCRRTAFPGWHLMIGSTLRNLMPFDGNDSDRAESCRKAIVKFPTIKHMWDCGKNIEAVKKMQVLTQDLVREDSSDPHRVRLKAKCYRQLGMWKGLLHTESAEYGSGFDKRAERERVLELTMTDYRKAMEADPTWDKAWVAWGLVNYRLVEHTLNCVGKIHHDITAVKGKQGQHRHHQHQQQHQHQHQQHHKQHHQQSQQSYQPNPEYVVNAMHAFFKAICLNLDDSTEITLRLLQLWFSHGDIDEVQVELVDGLGSVPVDRWLRVLPQFIACMDIQNDRIQQSLFKVLCDIAWEHPQQLIIPLLCVTNSGHHKTDIATRILNTMRQHQADLVAQAICLAEELERVSFLWHEQWNAALQTASTLYFDSSDYVGMTALLEPLYQLLDNPKTLHEVAFVQSFGPDLHNAAACLARSQDARDIGAAWRYYHDVFLRIQRMLPNLTLLNLNDVSPKLQRANNLKLAVPGTYTPNRPLVRIVSFDSELLVIASKQRPRKLSLRGSDGRKFTYLLKAQEDLRVDERVMAFFGMVNQLMRQSKQRHREITRYSVTPLSENAGLIGWVPNCDTLHSLIIQYRKRKDIVAHAEHMHIRRAAPETKNNEGRPTDKGYDQLPSLHKIEVFENALRTTSGEDLSFMLWYTSPDLERWLERRTAYTKSLAVMSMVGYILGLGDRHPSNIMIDRVTGAICHIDFGDCFEVAQHRTQYKEQVPFRLTRVLVNAFDLGGIDGMFLSTCDKVMHLLRENNESLLAILELFVYDPLVDWRRNKRVHLPGDKSVNTLLDMGTAGTNTGTTGSNASHILFGDVSVLGFVCLV